MSQCSDANPIRCVMGIVFCTIYCTVESLLTQTIVTVFCLRNALQVTFGAQAPDYFHGAIDRNVAEARLKVGLAAAVVSIFRNDWVMELWRKACSPMLWCGAFVLITGVPANMLRCSHVVISPRLPQHAAGSGARLWDVFGARKVPRYRTLTV